VKLVLEKYQQQLQCWPKEGRHVLAQFDEDRVIVYQAYRPEIGLFAARNGYFGGAFSYSRMSWIKTNFLWMMYRCGWAQKEGQEVVLAIHLKRRFFDRLLLRAFPSSNTEGLPPGEWNEKIRSSDVRLQWDPDHDPYGSKQTRKAIQIGLRNQFLEPFKGAAILQIENVTDFVVEQRGHVESSHIDDLVLPLERCYPVSTEAQLNLKM